MNQHPPGSINNPLHASTLNRLVDATDYRSGSGKQWVRTVCGTAFHALMRDYLTTRKITKDCLAYLKEAIAAERDGVEWGRDQNEPWAWGLIHHWFTAITAKWSPPKGPLFCEWSFLLSISINGQDVWFEGTADLIAPEAAEIIDYKTGSKPPDHTHSAQHHLYCLAARYALWSNPKHHADRHQLDWATITEPLRKFSVAAPRFTYLLLDRMVGASAGAWSMPGFARDSKGMREDDSLAYITELTKRYLENQPTRLAVAIPAEPSQPENEMGNPQTTAIIPAQITQPFHAPKYELTAAEVVAQGQKIQEVMRAAMKVDEDYGIIPGTSRKDRDGNEKSKPTLLKPGAEKLLLLFRLAPTFEITKTADGEHREIFVRCKLTHIVSGDFVGEGVGECSTRESKYAWRQADRKCPKCEQPAIFKSKKDGGWFCWDKKGGCGAQFRAGEQSIEGQEIGRKPNPDLADTYNTVTKMACKRALVMAVLNTTGASFLFTQDLEDFASDAPTHYESEVIAPAPEQPVAPQFTWGEPRGEGFATDAQIKRLKANCAAMGVGETKCLARIIQLAGEFGTAGIASVAEIPFPVATKIVIKVEEALKAKGIPRPEREKTEAERIEEQVRQIVGELRTKRAKELAELVRSGPLSATEIIDIMANEAAPDVQFSALAEPQQEQVLHTIKRAAQAAADRVALAANGNGHH